MARVFLPLAGRVLRRLFVLAFYKLLQIFLVIAVLPDEFHLAYQKICTLCRLASAALSVEYPLVYNQG